MTIHLTGATISIGGTDVTSYVQSVSIPLDPWQESMLQRVYDLPDGRLRLTGPWAMTTRGRLAPGTWEAIEALWEHWRLSKRHRVRRMHAAYGRRRGRGRW